MFKYLKYTSSFSLCFENDKPVLDGYINTLIASDVDFRKFTSRYLMTFMNLAQCKRTNELTNEEKEKKI
jgi:hypothetical protein